MTTEQAIKELKSDRELYGSEIVYAGDGTPEGDLMLALDMGIAALEKQIPRKCRIKRAAKLQTFYCPTCEQVVVSRIENEWLAGRLQKYCDSCGQALDWGDNNA